MSDRRLATIRKINKITAIEGADAIETAWIGGWPVVVKKGEHSEGDLVVYCEIDSWIPHELAPFLSKGSEPRVFEGVRGERLRTIKLRGQLSQGLILPLHVTTDSEEGSDVTEALGIIKWEKPIPAQLAGQVMGNFPSFIPKTDQERIQNIIGLDDTYFEITEKLDGSSMTVFEWQGHFGVCSRNLELKEDENNAMWKVARELNLAEKILGVALQGEIIGPGIQGNPYKLSAPAFFIYDVYDIAGRQYLKPHQVRLLCATLGLETVPVIDVKHDVSGLEIADILSLADGFSFFNKNVRREGLVFKAVEGCSSFKAISNVWLLKTGE